MRATWVLILVLAACETGGGSTGRTRTRDFVPGPDGGPDVAASPPDAGPASPDASAGLFPGRSPPQHPFMAPNGRSNIHNDGFMTDAYDGPGPVGRSPEVRTAELGALCGTITFDRLGRVVTVCASPRAATLYLLDPATLQTIALHSLPPRPATEPGQNPLQDFSGGGYFYLDHEDRAVVSTGARTIEIVAVGEASLDLVRTIDLAGVLPEEERLTSALPDTTGRLWFVAKKRGVVGVVDGEDVRTLTLEEPIQNSFAVDADGSVFVVTDAALYRLEAPAGGAPAVVWRVVYENTGTRKPGQAAAGSGTTPTLMDDGYVAITDNADPMNVVVYRRAALLDGPRELCRVPVFGAGTGSTENSLIASGRSLFVENNFGYEGLASVAGSATTEPGFARVEIREDASGCDLVWSSDAVSAPSVVPKLSRATGLVYAYTKAAETWFFTALEAETGEVAWQHPAGDGALFNNNYAGLALGPDGAAYVGTLLGVVRLADGP